MYLANYVPGTLPDARDSKMKDTGPKFKDFMEPLGRPTGGKLGINATGLNAQSLTRKGHPAYLLVWGQGRLPRKHEV